MRRFWIGLSCFLIYAVLGYWVFYIAAIPDAPPATVQFVSATLVFGLGLGFAAQLAFDWNFTRPLRRVLVNSYIAIAIFALVLILLKFETLICVVVIAPVAMMLILAGAWLMRRCMSLFVSPPKLSLSILVLPLVFGFTGVLPPSRTQTFTVATSLVIEADSQRLFTLVQTVPAIQPQERRWTITHNLLQAPGPISAMTRDGIRTAYWTEGVSFQEILQPSPEQDRLSWRFHFPDLAAMQALDYRIAPTGPDVIMQTGGYRFAPLQDGATKVTLTTTYQLNTPINLYLALWGQLFLDDFHLAVLHVIKQRAETPSQPAAAG